MPLSTLFLLLVLSSHYTDVFGKSSSSNQHKLLNSLFDQYNKAVRPVLNDSLPIDVQFGIQLRKIMKVDSKTQELTVSVWITQVWKNPFLKWSSNVVEGLTSIVVDPGEVWIPDIGLMNNADDSVALAGGKEKFKTAVVVQNDGTCTWRAPATFKSDCDINVRFWPFDVQRCSMLFSSYTYGRRKVTLNLLKQSQRKADRFTASGGWTSVDIVLDKKIVKNSCCVELFDTIQAELVLKRKPQYFVLNFIIPSAVLCFLTLISFAIPSESGERIGFITTLLLAMTVYLLLIAEVLPETSNELPITGLLFVLTIIESAVILIFTIIILRCYHATGEPYGFLQRLYSCCCPRKHKRPSVSTGTSKVMVNGEVNDGMEDPSDIPVAIKQSKEFESPTWEDISLFFNRIFFIISVIMIGVTYVIVCLNAFYFSTQV